MRAFVYTISDATEKERVYFDKNKIVFPAPLNAISVKAVTARRSMTYAKSKSNNQILDYLEFDTWLILRDNKENTILERPIRELYNKRDGHFDIKGDIAFNECYIEFKQGKQQFGEMDIELCFLYELNKTN